MRADIIKSGNGLKILHKTELISTKKWNHSKMTDKKNEKTKADQPLKTGIPFKSFKQIFLRPL